MGMKSSNEPGSLLFTRSCIMTEVCTSRYKKWQTCLTTPIAMHTIIILEPSRECIQQWCYLCSAADISHVLRTGSSLSDTSQIFWVFTYKNRFHGILGVRLYMYCIRRNYQTVRLRNYGPKKPPQLPNPPGP